MARRPRVLPGQLNLFDQSPLSAEAKAARRKRIERDERLRAIKELARFWKAKK
jgi:hypothetical protein